MVAVGGSCQSSPHPICLAFGAWNLEFEPRSRVVVLFRSNWYLPVLVGAILLATGCTDRRPQTYPLTGKVTIGDQVVPSGSVTLAPRGGGRLVVTAINEDGSYRLEAVPGTYQVGIASPPELPAGREAFEQPAPPSLVPDWYGYPVRSGIEVTVEDKEENVFDIVLQ